MAKNNSELRTLAVALAISLFALPVFSQTYSKEFLTDIPTGSRGMVSGPEVGERIPDFEALNQHGDSVSLADVMGPNGAMVVFVRSADW
mgnify:FL=1